jgi:DNA-binding transcriptional LysR family regulator
LALAEPAVAIREPRSLKITPRFRADYPPVDVTVTMRVSIAAKTRHRGVDLGVRTVAVDIEVDALGAVQGSG